MTITVICDLIAEFTDSLILMEYLIMIAEKQVMMTNLMMIQIHTIKIFVFDYTRNAAKLDQ